MSEFEAPDFFGPIPQPQGPIDKSLQVLQPVTNGQKTAMTDLHYSPVNSVHPQGCLQFQCLPEGVVPYQSALMSM